MGSVGHLQDIAVAKNQQGKNLGFRMLTALDCLAKEVGCYKVCQYSKISSIRERSDCHARLSSPLRKRMNRFMPRQAFVVKGLKCHITTCMVEPTRACNTNCHARPREVYPRYTLGGGSHVDLRISSRVWYIPSTSGITLILVVWIVGESQSTGEKVRHFAIAKKDCK